MTAVWGQGFEPYFGLAGAALSAAASLRGQVDDLAFALWNDPTSGVPQERDAGELRLYQNRRNPFARFHDNRPTRCLLRAGCHA